MKTLDEVIAEMEEMGFIGTLSDALHYLQTYRADKLEWEQTRQANEERYQEAVKNCERAENKFIARLKELDIGTLNEPLTWEQLKELLGKPVWLEDSNHQGEWVLLSGMEDDILYFVYQTCNEYKIYRKEQGTLWQAYRKERK